jgi:hypothetical protein
VKHVTLVLYPFCRVLSPWCLQTKRAVLGCQPFDDVEFPPLSSPRRSGGIGRRTRLKIWRWLPIVGVQVPPPAPTF